MTISGFLPALAAVLVGGLVTMRRFRSSASKSKMVSSGGRIVSSRLPNETRSRKLQYLQQHQSSIALVSVFHWPRAAGPRRRHRRPARRPAGKTLSKQAAPPQQTARSPSPSAAGSNEPKSCSLPTPSSDVQPLSGTARWHRLSTRDNVVGSSIDVGNEKGLAQRGRPTVERSAELDGLPDAAD